MFTFLPHLRRSTRRRTCSTHTPSSSLQQSTVCSQEGQGCCKHWAFRQISKLCNFCLHLLCFCPCWSCARAEIKYFCLLWAGSLAGSGAPVLTLNQRAAGEEGDRDNSEQHFSNICFLFEAYQTQIFTCFLKTYEEKWVLLFSHNFSHWLRDHILVSYRWLVNPTITITLQDQQHNLTSSFLLLENLF